MLDAIDFFSVMIRDFLLQMRKNTEVFYLYALKNSFIDREFSNAVAFIWYKQTIMTACINLNL